MTGLTFTRAFLVATATTLVMLGCTEMSGPELASEPELVSELELTSNSAVQGLMSTTQIQADDEPCIDHNEDPFPCPPPPPTPPPPVPPVRPVDPGSPGGGPSKPRLCLDKNEVLVPCNEE